MSSPFLTSASSDANPFEVLIGQDAKRRPCRANPHTRWSVIPTFAQIALDGLQRRGLIIMRGTFREPDQAQEAIERPHLFNLRLVHHKDVAIGAIFCAVPTANTALGIDIHLTIFVSKNGISRRTIRHAFRIFAMPTGTWHQKIAENVSFGAIESCLPAVSTRAGLHALIAPDALIFIDQQYVGAFEHPAIDQLIDEMILTDLPRKHFRVPHHRFPHALA